MSQPLFFLLALCLSLFFINSNGNNTSSYCPSHMCGDVNISYPFWRLGDTTSNDQYCGYQGLGLNCSDDKAIIYLSDAAFYVTNIPNSTYAVTLVDMDVSANAECPRAHHNLTLDSVPLYYSELEDRNLTFYFNCSSYDPDPFGHYRIPCLESDENKSYVSWEPGGFDWLDHCEEKVVAHVMKREINVADLMSGRLGRAMNKGFVLNWRPTKDCDECQHSDGLCGYNNRTGAQRFMCFCSNGHPTNKHCRVKKTNWGLKIGIGFAAAATGILFMCLIFFLYHRRNKKRYAASYLVSQNTSSYTSSMGDLEKAGSYYGVQMFSYGDLEEATNNFDSKKELGDGGFGTVYEGKLKDGRVVAVKRLYENNYKRVEQFINEIEILTRLRHQNLVSLYGCTSRHCRELLLVYEYIPNGTVADHLHGDRAKLTWNTRMNIAIETASALAFLHASDVIHRDVKTNNILLDNNLCVKVADFGLSRLFPNDVTHITTAPQGTPGYVDPEYHKCYQLTDKSDVYSFGVVLVELISSKLAVDITRHRREINLSDMAISKIQSRALDEFVDPCLGFQSDYKVRKMITDVAELAFQCLQNESDMRPHMEEVLEALKRIQNEGYDPKKAEEVDIPPDDVVLLKSDPALLSL